MTNYIFAVKCLFGSLLAILLSANFLFAQQTSVSQDSISPQDAVDFIKKVSKKFPMHSENESVSETVTVEDVKLKDNKLYIYWKDDYSATSRIQFGIKVNSVFCTYKIDIINLSQVTNTPNGDSYRIVAKDLAGIIYKSVMLDMKTKDKNLPTEYNMYNVLESSFDSLKPHGYGKKYSGVEQWISYLVDTKNSEFIEGNYLQRLKKAYDYLTHTTPSIKQPDTADKF